MALWAPRHYGVKSIYTMKMNSNEARHYSNIYYIVIYPYVQTVLLNRTLLTAFWKQPQYACCQPFLVFGFRELHDKVRQYFIVMWYRKEF